MKVHEIIKQLCNAKIQTSFLFETYLPGIGNCDTNCNNHLENISQAILKRHGITLVDSNSLDELPDDNCNREEKTITIANRESWRYCEFYYAQLFMSISHFRSKPPFIARDFLIDSVVSYKILDYFMQNNLLTEAYLASQFKDFGGEYYGGNYEQSASGIVLYVDRQINLILNHKSNKPLNYDHVDYPYFREKFNISNPYLEAPDFEEYESEWVDLDDFYENFCFI